MPNDQEKICLMFDRIAPTYDAVNRILSMRQDIRWRRFVADALPKYQPLRLLDLATGTADLLIDMCESNEQISEAYGVDIAEKMLAIGQKKVAHIKSAATVKLIQASAAKLPFQDAYFDVVSIAFGIRNFTEIDESLREIKRVLKPGGTLLILEFSLPKNSFIRHAYLFYFRNILPFLGGYLSRDKAAYSYLNKTVENFPYSKAFLDILRRAGFVELSEQALSFGIATLYRGQRSC